MATAANDSPLFAPAIYSAVVVTYALLCTPSIAWLTQERKPANYDCQDAPHR